MSDPSLSGSGWRSSQSPQHWPPQLSCSPQVTPSCLHGCSSRITCVVGWLKLHLAGVGLGHLYGEGDVKCWSAANSTLTSPMLLVHLHPVHWGVLHGLHCVGQANNCLIYFPESISIWQNENSDSSLCHVFIWFYWMILILNTFWSNDMV